MRKLLYTISALMIGICGMSKCMDKVEEARKECERTYGMSPGSVGKSAVSLLETPGSDYTKILEMLQPILDTQEPSILYVYGVAGYNGKKNKQYIHFIIESAKEGFTKAKRFLSDEFHIPSPDIERKTETQLLSELTGK